MKNQETKKQKPKLKPYKTAAASGAWARAAAGGGAVRAQPQGPPGGLRPETGTSRVFRGTASSAPSGRGHHPRRRGRSATSLPSRIPEKGEGLFVPRRPFAVGTVSSSPAPSPPAPAAVAERLSAATAGRAPPPRSIAGRAACGAGTAPQHPHTRGGRSRPRHEGRCWR